MNYFWLSSKIILTILIATSCGAMLARKKILHQQALKDLTNVLVYVILPCLIFGKILSAISFEALNELWIFPTAALINVAAGLLLGYILSLFCNKQKEFKSGIVVSVAFNNCIYIPLVIVAAITTQAAELFSDEAAAAKGITYLSLYLVPFIILIWLLAYPILAHHKMENFKISKIITPPVIATFAAIFFGLIPWTKTLFVGCNAPLGMFHQAAEILGKATMPMALIILGGNLANSYGKTKIRFSTGLLVVIGKFLISPIIAILILFVLRRLGCNLSPIMSFIILLEGFMPPAMNLVVISQFADANKENMAALMFWMYLISIPVMTIWLTIIMKMI